MKYLVILSLFLIACSSEEDKDNTGGGTTPPSVEVIESLPGGNFYRTASDQAIFIESDLIYFSNGQLANGAVIEVIPQNGITLSLNNTTYSSFIETTVVSGRVRFYIKISPTVGTYRFNLKVKGSPIIGPHYYQIFPAAPSLIGEISTTTFEDLAPYNGIKDLNESYTMRADGLTTQLIKVGPLRDMYNNLTNGDITLSTTAGTILGGTTKTTSSGEVYFTLRSSSNVETAILSATINSTTIQEQIKFVRPNLEMLETNYFGSVLINNPIEKVFTIQNNGGEDAKNLTFSVDSIFTVKNDSTCSTINSTTKTLRIGESCFYRLEFINPTRGDFDGLLSVSGEGGQVLLSEILSVSVEAPAILNLSQNMFNFNDKACESVNSQEFFIRNIGGTPATGLTEILNHVNSGAFSIRFPPADINPPTDVEEIINCGNEVPIGRKCRVYVDFIPNMFSLNSLEELTIGVDDTNPMTITVSGNSSPGAVSDFPVKLTTPTNPTGNDLLPYELNLGQNANIVMGPVKDACGFTIPEPTVSIFKTAGTSPTSLQLTNGEGDFLWMSGTDHLTIGTQSISIELGDEEFQKNVVFRGVNYSNLSVNDYGSLEINQMVSRDIEVVNLGNLMTSVADMTKSGDWFVIDTVNSTCQHQLLPGNSCIIRLTINIVDAGNKTGTVYLATASPGNSSIEIPITASGYIEDKLILTETASKTFGTAGETDMFASFTLENEGLSDIPITITTSDPSLSLRGDTTCTNLLEELCEIHLSYLNNTKGTHEVELIINSSLGEIRELLTFTVSISKADVINITQDKTVIEADTVEEGRFEIVSLTDSYGNEIEVLSEQVLRVYFDFGTVYKKTYSMVPVLDEDGDPILDVNGDPIMEPELDVDENPIYVDEYATGNYIDIEYPDESIFYVKSSAVNEGGYNNIRFKVYDIEYEDGAPQYVPVMTPVMVQAEDEDGNPVFDDDDGEPLMVPLMIPVLDGNGDPVFDELGEPLMETVMTQAVDEFGDPIFDEIIPTVEVLEERFSEDRVLRHRVRYTITVNTPVNGSLSQTTQTVLDGDTFSIDATPNSGYSFHSWTGACNFSLTSSCTFMVSADATIGVNFTQYLDSYHVLYDSQALPPEIEINKNSCSLAVSGELRNIFNTTLNSLIPYQVNLVSSSPDLKAYSDASCTTEITQLNPLSFPNFTFYVKGSASEAATISLNETTRQRVINFKVNESAMNRLELDRMARFGCYYSLDDILYCWGLNNYGNLGNGTTNNTNAPVAVNTSGPLMNKKIIDFSVGRFQVCAITDDNGLYCWGENYQGSLGTGDLLDRHVPTLVNTSGVLNGKTFVKVSTNGYFTCVLDSDGKAYCWGWGPGGSLGDGINRPDSRSLIPVAVYTGGVLSGKKLVDIFAARGGNCAIDEDGKVYCWGVGTSGQLGNGILAHSNVPVAVNMNGDLLGKKIKEIKSSEHSQAICALADDGRLYCWGDGANGILGSGSASNIQYSTPIRVDAGGLSSHNIIDFGMGYDYICALTDASLIFCYGRNARGQLGTGNTTSNPVPVEISSNVLNPLKNIIGIDAVGNTTFLIYDDESIETFGTSEWGIMGAGLPVSDTIYHTPQNVLLP